MISFHIFSILSQKSTCHFNGPTTVHPEADCQVVSRMWRNWAWAVMGRTAKCLIVAPWLQAFFVLQQAACCCCECCKTSCIEAEVKTKSNGYLVFSANTIRGEANCNKKRFQISGVCTVDFLGRKFFLFWCWDWLWALAPFFLFKKNGRPVRQSTGRWLDAGHRYIIGSNGIWLPYWMVLTVSESVFFKPIVLDSFGMVKKLNLQSPISRFHQGLPEFFSGSQVVNQQKALLLWHDLLGKVGETRRASHAVGQWRFELWSGSELICREIRQTSEGGCILSPTSSFVSHSSSFFFVSNLF